MGSTVLRILSLSGLIIISLVFTASAQSFAPDKEKASCPISPSSESQKIACEDLIKIYPNDPDLYFNIGNYFYEKQEKNTAQYWYLNGLQRAPDYYRSHLISASLAHDHGDIEKQFAELNIAISMNTMDPRGYYSRADAWRLKGNFDKAITDYTEAIRLEPKYKEAYVSRGGTWMYKRNYDKAIADLNQAIRLDQNYSLAYRFRGRLWFDKGNLDKAIADYNEAIKLDPKDLLAYMLRSYCWERKENHDKGIADLNEAIKLDPKNRDAYINRAVHFFLQKKYDNAISDLNEAIKLDSKNELAYRNRGAIWVEKDNYDQAIADLNEAIRLDPKDELAYRNRGLTWLKKVNYDLAIADFRESLRLNPSQANTKESLELALIQKNRRENQALIQQKKLFSLPSSSSSSSSSSLSATTLSQVPLYPSSSFGKRVALVIGNSKYKNIDALENPSKDAELIAMSLKSVGFDDVVIKLNQSREQMILALKEFEKKAETANWAVIYFAGHGIEVSGTNYLMPIDAQKIEGDSVSSQTVNLQYLLNSVEFASKLRLVIIDACRNNPYVKQVKEASASRHLDNGSLLSSIGSGLARIEPQPGTLIIYAAKAGSYALDGDGNNSPFAEALSKRIHQKPAIEVWRLFDFVRQDVFAVTNREQQPFSYGSLEASEDFYFMR